jgi:FtsH-binding integral membrane protein
MKKSVLQYTYQLAGLTLILGLATWIFTLLFQQVKVTPAYPCILGFLFLFAWLAFFFSAKSMQKKISRFANMYMVINFLKLIIFSAFLLGYAYLHKDDASSFIVTFFVYYVFYTALEVFGLKELNKKVKS